MYGSLLAEVSQTSASRENVRLLFRKNNSVPSKRKHIKVCGRPHYKYTGKNDEISIVQYYSISLVLSLPDAV